MISFIGVFLAVIQTKQIKHITAFPHIIIEAISIKSFYIN